MLPLLLLSFAVSVDGFGVGVTYGLRRIRIPMLSVLIITGCSGIVILLAMKVGAWLSGFVSPEGAKLIGAAILMLIGSYTLAQQLRRVKEEEVKPDAGSARDNPDPAAMPEGGPNGAPLPPAAVLTLEIKKLGLVIQILKTPQAADMDSSGSISAGEALLLGSALSLDAFGAGLGAAMVGLVPWVTACCIMLASGLFLVGGLRFGFRFSGVNRMKALSFLPGVLLLLIGFGKLW
ncbi:sporulation membrane protein YtaF [Paenibacillus sp. RUD330]|nr:sporulation membrane protein YtaF [Paenibacillus sp. RUD330]